MEYSWLDGVEKISNTNQLHISQFFSSNCEKFLLTEYFTKHHHNIQKSQLFFYATFQITGYFFLDFIDVKLSWNSWNLYYIGIYLEDFFFCIFWKAPRASKKCMSPKLENIINFSNDNLSTVFFCLCLFDRVRVPNLAS